MRLVVTLAEECNFTRAASRCHVSQPALSRQIRDVEEVLEIKLFERQSRCVQITEAGKLFVREAQRTLEQSYRTTSLVQAFARRQQRPIAVGLSPLADAPRFHRCLDRVQKSVAESNLTVHIAYTPELITDLARGDLDLAIVDLPFQQHGIRLFPLSDEPLVLVLPEAQKNLSSLRMAELMTMPMVLLSESIDPGRAVMDRAIRSVGVRAFKIRNVESIPQLLDEVALHHRIGLLRQSATRFQRQGVVYKPLSDSIPIGCALAWRNERAHWPALASFRDALIASFQQP